MFKQNLFNLFSNGFIFLILLTPISSFAKKPLPPAPEPPADTAPIGTTQLISKSSEGVQGNSNSYNNSISADGRFFVFSSIASNLVSDDTNGVSDVFIHDGLTAITERISVASDGTQADDKSHRASMSADGRYIVFTSSANNLVAGVQSYYSQVYLHDRLSRTTQRVSIAPDGSLANAHCRHPAINADGRYIVYSSNANNLVANDSQDTFSDVFLYDRLNYVTEKMSVMSDGRSANNFSLGASITDDGQIVAFTSIATNLVDDDTNNSNDIFLHHRSSGITERVHISNNANQAKDSSGGRISGNGQFIVFNSSDANLVDGDTNYFADVFVHDRSISHTERVNISNTGSQANDDSFTGRISADGRFVTYLSYANNLSTKDNYLDWWSDIFLYDRLTKVTELISVSSDGTISNYDSGSPAISNNGRFISFESYATNLAVEDNGLVRSDIYIRDRNP